MGLLISDGRIEVHVLHISCPPIQYKNYCKFFNIAEQDIKPFETFKKFQKVLIIFKSAAMPFAPCSLCAVLSFDVSRMMRYISGA